MHRSCDNTFMIPSYFSKSVQTIRNNKQKRRELPRPPTRKKQHHKSIMTNTTTTEYYTAIPTRDVVDNHLLLSEFHLLAEMEQDSCNNNNNEDHDHKKFRRFNRWSLLLGLVSGFGIQFNTLGTIYLMVALNNGGEEEQPPIITKFGTGETCFMVLATLLYFSVVFGFQHSLVAVAFNNNNGTAPTDAPAAAAARRKEKARTMFLCMNLGFLVGYMVSYALSWSMPGVFLSIPNVFLGMEKRSILMVYMAIVGGLALLASTGMVWVSSSRRKSSSGASIRDEDSKDPTPV